MNRIISILLLLTVISACSSGNLTEDKADITAVPSVYYEIPLELKDINKYTDLMRSYSEHLNGRTVFIDPGHGGQDRSNMSRDGKIVEADINLNVALYLRDFLQSAGASVVMARVKDTTVSLEERSLMANESKADILVSVHHNSATKIEDNWTNYTVTFYHANVGDYEYEPFDHTLAKYIQRDLSYAMRNSGGLGSFDGTQSDYRVYPDEGFALLKETVIPAVLVECSFFTSRLEEQRLSIDEFNRIEGWGIFLGIAKMFSTGIPEFRLVKDKSQFRRKNLSLYFKIENDSRVDETSIKVYFDKKVIKHSYDDVEETLSVFLNDVSKGEHDLKIELANKNGIYSFPYHRKIVIN